MNAQQDLVALVADGHQEKALHVLLNQRIDSLGICGIRADVYVHPMRDPGVYRQAAGFLAPFQQSHRYALVMLDVSFPGSPGSRAAIECEIEKRLAQRGWIERSQVVAIEPELEAWVWSDSPHVADVLGQRRTQIRRFAERHGWWRASDPKPREPGRLFRAVLREARKPPSAAIFGELAKRVSLERCADPAFAKLRATLRTWFGRPEPIGPNGSTPGTAPRDA